VKPVIVKAKGRKKQKPRDISVMQRELLDFQEAKYIEYARRHTDARGLFAEIENVTAAALGCSRSTVSRILKRCAAKKKVRITSAAHYDKASGKQTLNVIWPYSEPYASVNTDQPFDKTGTSEKEAGEAKPCSSENAHTTVCNSSSDCVSGVGCNSSGVEHSSVNTDFPRPTRPTQPTPLTLTRNVPALLREEQTELGFWESTKNIAKADGCRQKIAELQSELDGAS
jgi:hypothetical protein